MNNRSMNEASKIATTQSPLNHFIREVTSTTVTRQVKKCRSTSMDFDVLKTFLTYLGSLRTTPTRKTGRTHADKSHFSFLASSLEDAKSGPLMAR